MPDDDARHRKQDARVPRVPHEGVRAVGDQAVAVADGHLEREERAESAVARAARIPARARQHRAREEQRRGVHLLVALPRGECAEDGAGEAQAAVCPCKEHSDL